MIREIVHLNINVTDLERSLAFYRMLGFEVMHAFGELPGEESEGSDGGMQMGDTRVRGAVVSLGEHPRAATKIELLQWLEPETKPSPRREAHAGGVARIAMRTKDLLGFCEKLRSEGIDLELEPQEIDIVGARRFCLFRDPDGILLELVEF